MSPSAVDRQHSAARVQSRLCFFPFGGSTTAIVSGVTFAGLYTPASSQRVHENTCLRFSGLPESRMSRSPIGSIFSSSLILPAETRTFFLVYLPSSFRLKPRSSLDSKSVMWQARGALWEGFRGGAGDVKEAHPLNEFGDHPGVRAPRKSESGNRSPLLQSTRYFETPFGCSRFGSASFHSTAISSFFPDCTSI